ncbi:hypothetical protein EYC84_000626 [Monilinia fructicola]|uniref:Uncharacterized protein n=1 Tax=Monilinia fructicola TaxID=38448 RepID=A0A5M9JTX0_MONFR|nr:hypothetical protein EYC84_000626 [Monilinia fructicola]
MCARLILAVLYEPETAMIELKINLIFKDTFHFELLILRYAVVFNTSLISPSSHSAMTGVRVPGNIACAVYSASSLWLQKWLRSFTSTVYQHHHYNGWCDNGLESSIFSVAIGKVVARNLIECTVGFVIPISFDAICRSCCSPA